MVKDLPHYRISNGSAETFRFSSTFGSDRIPNDLGLEVSKIPMPNLEKEQLELEDGDFLSFFGHWGMGRW